MAEATVMRNNALPYPVYGVAFTIVVPLLDADGDPVSPSSPDSEVSKNGDTFTDCTNEATEIATGSGVVYLTMTSTEMTADIVAVRIQSTGAKTTIVTLYPRKLPILSTGTCQGSNDTSDIQLASGDSAVNDTYNGCLCVAVIDGTTEARVINDYVGSTKVAEIAPAWNTAQPDSNDTYTIYLPEGRQVPTTNALWWNSLETVKLPLAPTVAGRDLDVTAGGCAGVDWANVEAPTTTVGLSGTTVKTATDVETDTADIQSRLPAALVSGRMDSNMQAAANGVITAAVIAADAIGASELAADAVAEIQSGLATSSALSTLQSTVDGLNDLSAAEVNTEVDTALADIHLDHLIAVADPGSIVANSSFLAKLVSKSATPAFSSYNNTTDSLEALRDRGDAAWITATSVTVSDKTGFSLSTAGNQAVADQVWEELIADHSGTSGSTAEALAAAGGAGDPWITSLPGSYTSGQAGYILGTYLDAAISSRLASASISLSGGAVTVGTNNDKTGYRLSATGVDDIWDEPLAAHTTSDTPGKVLNMLTQDTVTLSTEVALGSIVGQLLDGGTSWTYDRTTDSLEVLGQSIADILTDTSTTLQGELDNIEALIGTPASTLAADIAGLNDITAADVWAAGTRTLTSAANITSTGGTTVPQTGDSFARIGATGSGLTTLATAASIAALNNLSAAQVNAEVVDALNTDTYAEPSQGAPGATISLAAKLNWLYASWRNKKDNDGSVTNLYADNGTTVVAKQTTSSSGGTVTKAEWITGA